MPRPHQHAFVRSGPDSLVMHLLQSSVTAMRSISPFEAQQKLHDLLAGIRKYQTCNLPLVTRDVAVIWQQGPIRLLHIKGAAKKRKSSVPVVLIPSLVNSWEILDLRPKQSFARYLQQEGFDVHVIDWGDLRESPDLKTLDQVLFDYLAPMVRMVARTAAQNVITVGYCMGGLLMAGAYPEIRDVVRAQIYLATPWDFHAGDPRLTQLVRTWAPPVLDLLRTTDYLPNTQIQMLFASVDPEMAINKFSRFYQMDFGEVGAQNFVAVEDWLQTGRDLPRDMGLTCLQDWYLNNETGAGTWEIGGHKIKPRDLAQTPSLVVAPLQDRLVETQTATALAKMMGKGATLHTPETGHIGMMASTRAPKAVWEPIVKWLKPHL